MVTVVKQYEDNIMVGIQQTQSMLRDKGIIKTGVKGKSKSFGWVDEEDARQKTSRLSDTIWDDASANRVTAYLTPWYKGLMQDKDDEIRMIADPKSAYVQTVLNSLRRKIDSLIITALRGTKYTGENGTTASALPSGRKIAAGSAGLNLTKMRQALELLTDKGDGVSQEGEKKFMLITSKQRTDLLSIAEVTSADYNTVRTLTSGKVIEFLGFTFIVVDSALLPKSGTTRYCIAWRKSGLGIAFGKDITVRVDEIQSKHYNWGVYAAMDVGATRIEDENVVEIACTES